MKAVVLRGPRDLVVQELPDWPLSPDMVMVRVRACGICGSDLRYYAGENPWALHTLGHPVPNPQNMVLGHEFAGEVCSVGSPEHEHLLGKRVGALCFVTCGTCRFCRTGRENLCRNTIHIGHGAGWGVRPYYPGAMAEYCPMWARQCFELPDSMSFEEAALLDPLQVAVHAIDVSGLRAGDTFAVFGLGPIGVSCLQIARIRGARVLIGTDVYPRPLAIARELGATLALNTQEADGVSAIRGATGDMGVDVVIDTVGSQLSLTQELSVLARGGTLVTLAVHPGDYRFDGLAIGAERSIRTSSNCLFKDYQRALDLVAAGLVRMQPMITHRFPLADAPHAFDLLARKEQCGAVKIIIVPS